MNIFKKLLLFMFMRSLELTLSLNWEHPTWSCKRLGYQLISPLLCSFLKKYDFRTWFLGCILTFLFPLPSFEVVKKLTSENLLYPSLLRLETWGQWPYLLMSSNVSVSPSQPLTWTMYWVLGLSVSSSALPYHTPLVSWVEVTSTSLQSSASTAWKAE